MTRYKKDQRCSMHAQPYSRESRDWRYAHRMNDIEQLINAAKRHSSPQSIKDYDHILYVLNIIAHREAQLVRDRSLGLPGSSLDTCDLCRATLHAINGAVPGEPWPPVRSWSLDAQKYYQR